MIFCVPGPVCPKTALFEKETPIGSPDSPFFLKTYTVPGTRYTSCAFILAQGGGRAKKSLDPLKANPPQTITPPSNREIPLLYILRPPNLHGLRWPFHDFHQGTCVEHIGRDLPTIIYKTTSGASCVGHEEFSGAGGFGSRHEVSQVQAFLGVAIV